MDRIDHGMRIRLLSDLHLEYCPWTAPVVDADVVVLAGDIHNGLAGIRWAAEQFTMPVIYVPGNHEYDWHDLIKQRGHWRTPEWPDHVQVLDDRVVEIGGVRFVGSTLWTDFSLYGDVATAMDAAKRTVSDYTRIRCGPAALTPAQTLNLHERSLAWLDATLGDPFSGHTVVVSHHCPHPNSIEAKYAASAANPAFASDLTELMQRHDIKTWLHGHTHMSLDQCVENTRIVCNPRGYANQNKLENAHFKPELVIEV